LFGESKQEHRQVGSPFDFFSKSFSNVQIQTIPQTLTGYAMAMLIAYATAVYQSKLNLMKDVQTILSLESFVSPRGQGKIDSLKVY
jgi:multidrug transporter EmrE-like cation transporter